MKRRKIEESTHQITAMQENSAKILRLTAPAQDDSLFFEISLLGYLCMITLMRQRHLLRIIRVSEFCAVFVHAIPHDLTDTQQRIDDDLRIVIGIFEAQSI